MKRINLKNATFIIPARVDTEDRLENINLIIDFLQTYFETNIYILEADKEEKIKVPRNVRKDFIKDEDPLFRKAYYVNHMARNIDTSMFGLWDADVIGIPDQIKRGFQLIQEGGADMVFPYHKYFYSVPRNIKKQYIENNYNLNVLQENQMFMELMHGDWSVGGAFLIDRKVFMDAGMENENFYGWGPEDAELVARVEILGYRLRRIEGPLFHLFHKRGITSWYGNKEIEIRNRNEFIKICGMNRLELKAYIQNAPWVAK